MRSDPALIRFLLDEHYPGWLAEKLSVDGVDTVALCAHRPELRGMDDGLVLEAAAAEGRIVVTEDVTTFSAATARVPDHVGVVCCHHARYPRNPAGLNRLHQALVGLAADPPDGLGQHPVEWWLPALGC
jgi:predicted nuclease of predicted toxin-antitoxin system